MSGKRAAPRRAARSGGTRRGRVPVMLLGVVLTAVAWTYLVRAAIDFGASARQGDPSAWAFVGLASLGAIACLFAALMLLTWTSRAIGITRGPDAGPRVKGAKGGRRAAR